MVIRQSISMDEELWEIVNQVMRRYRFQKRSHAVAFIFNEYARMATEQGQEFVTWNIPSDKKIPTG